MLIELIISAHEYGIPAFIDLVADIGFVICVPFAIYFFVRRGSL